jgi:hypothetical protein
MQSGYIGQAAGLQPQPGLYNATTFISILKREAAFQSEMPVSTTMTTRCHNPKDRNLSFPSFMEPFLPMLNTIYTVKDIPLFYHIVILYHPPAPKLPSLHFLIPLKP